MAETRSLRTFRIVLWSLVVVAAIAATVLFFVSQDQRNRGETTILGGPGGGEFALVDQRGAPVDRTIFTGHPSLLFFGYTHCPDVCPTTMGEMQGWFEALGEEGKTLRGVFVTVDPARDTPELLDGYVSWVSDRIVALTGEQSEIDKVVKDWAPAPRGRRGRRLPHEPHRLGVSRGCEGPVRGNDRLWRGYGRRWARYVLLGANSLARLRSGRRARVRASLCSRRHFSTLP